jgi:hypothetical protein
MSNNIESDQSPTAECRDAAFNRALSIPRKPHKEPSTKAAGKKRGGSASEVARRHK